MARFPQCSGPRGSLKWIQRAVNSRPEILDDAILASLKAARSIEWLSPLATDGFAEYRDAAFLERIGHGELAGKLAAFWPGRGPQWDSLARTEADDILLVEAKAYIDEMFSSPTQVSESSRRMIEGALSAAAVACQASPRAPWTDLFYQLANRVAHLHFLRNEGLSAYLVLVNFLGHAEMKGPNSSAEWEAAYRVAYHVIGLTAGSPLLRYVIHVYPDTARLM